jgi:hypothetical protein
MPWYSAFGVGRRPAPTPVPSQAALEKKIFNALTAAAAPVKGPQTQFLQRTQEWQAEAWMYYDSLGELNSGVWWLANMLSRVRLRAAEVSPDLDEPTIANTGLASEIVNSLSGGVGGQSQTMRNLTLQLAVPGDCYLIGQGVAGKEDWTVRSVDEVRVQNGKFQTVSGRIPSIAWEDLPPGSLPVRIWRPHARFYHLSDSSVRSALPIMRELELVNRHITAQYLSRLASAGLIVLPDEITFPVREEFEDAADPFMAEFIEIAAEAIRTPGTASATIPIPIRVPGDYVDKIKHIDFTLKIDDKIIEKRESAISRLANKLDVPTEIMTGMSKVNHWTAWQLDESALKTHIAPLAEVICDSLTRGYLRPRMLASGATEEEAANFVIWYDMSELAVRPDKSANAFEAYDRLELSGAALRREGGFDEDDAPTDEELKDQALKVIIHTLPSGAMSALAQLINDPTLQPIVPVSPQAPDVAQKTQEGNTPDTTPVSAQSPAPSGEAPVAKEKPSAPEKSGQPGPPVEGEPPTKPPAKATVEQIAEQVRATHAIRFGLDSPGNLLHPPVCREHSYSCPFTHAARDTLPIKLSTGTYECHLDTFGRLNIGQPVPHLDVSSWLTTPGFTTAWKAELNGSRA